MKKITLFTIGIILLSIVACKKEPVETYYFNCKIDGQYFEPENQGGLGEYPITAKLLYNETDLRISVDKGVQSLSVGIIDTTVIKVGEYHLTKNALYHSRGLYYPSLSGNHYETDSVHLGKAFVTGLDKTNKIVEGTFYFIAYNSVLNDTIQITDGKFKLKYTLN